MTEFHDLSEIALNRDGEAWGNLGYWKDASDYSAACRALALLLGDAARLDEDSVIMDAGFGCGDQIALWRERYRVRHIRGVNHSRSQTSYARRKLVESGYDLDVTALRCGDIDDERSWYLDAGNEPANRVVALDCVYHFSSRKRFSKKAFQNLAPGGFLAVTDLLLGAGHGRSRWNDGVLRLMLRLSRIPHANIVKECDYLSELRQCGFERVEIQDIGAGVMPGFANWFRQFESGKSSLPWRSRVKYRITASFMEWASHRDILRYCVISAGKPLA